MAKLKVFVVPVGFHDAYVAATSRKAALKAWGSDHDLFARGLAQEVTDPTLTAEPLAKPGTVVKRSRGSAAAEQVAALPPDAPKVEKRRAEPEPEPAIRARRKPAKEAPQREAPPPKPVKLEPRPARDTLDAAEAALATAQKRHRAEDKAIADRQAALDRESRDTARAHGEEQETLAEAVDVEKGRYERAIKRWRG